MREVSILGAGLVGSLLSILLKKRGYKVDLYERRHDMRSNKIAAGRSINLAMSDRGWKALELAGLRSDIEELAIPMYGRFLHQADGSSAFQPYGKNNEAIYSVSRGELNKKLMSLAEKEGVAIHFDKRCVHADVQKNELTFVDDAGNKTEVKADLLFGADGAFSALRTAYVMTDRVDASQFYIEHGYKELNIPPDENGQMRLEKNALHIWPRRNFMLIGLPNTDGSFTCTLFFPFAGNPSFEVLKTKEEAREFFKIQFPDALAMMPTFDEDWVNNPVSSLITTRVFPWHMSDKSALIGDAAHAIVPFYGQGMNAGFEDCSVLNELMNEHDNDWTKILPMYEKARKINGDAVGELALINFVEMRDKVADAQFLERKKIEKDLGVTFAGKFNSVYEMVSFSHQPYSKALRLMQLQDELLQKIMNEGDYFTLKEQEDFKIKLQIWMEDYNKKAGE